MPTKSQTENRKANHVEICVRENVSHRIKSTGFEDLEFEHNALPELTLADISTDCLFLGHALQFPLAISSMTGGYAGALAINRNLAQAAERFGIAMGIGSERQALESETHEETFSIVRKEAPNAFLFGNIGGVEVARLFRENKLGELHRLVDLIEANAFAIHLNPLQELLQPEGSHDFRGVLAGIEACASTLEVPLIVKEVGAGISKNVAKQLLNVGVAAIDVAGAGGTSWAGVEILRNDASQSQKYEPFWDWGISSVDALLTVGELRSGIQFELIASGGIASGLDIAKSIALGASLGAMARPIIKTLVESGEQSLDQLLEAIRFQCQAAMYLTGSRTLAGLREQKLYKK